MAQNKTETHKARYNHPHQHCIYRGVIYSQFPCEEYWRKAVKTKTELSLPRQWAKYSWRSHKYDRPIKRLARKLEKSNDCLYKLISDSQKAGRRGIIWIRIKTQGVGPRHEAKGSCMSVWGRELSISYSGLVSTCQNWDCLGFFLFLLLRINQGFDQLIWCPYSASKKLGNSSLQGLQP